MDFSKKALKIDNQVLNHKDGIYFCNGNYKDLFLIEILKAMDELPDQIIVIDDIEKYLESMKYALEKNNFSIPFLGIRYSCLDDINLNFDPEAAEQELAGLL
jgi:hypothetical protein